MSLQEAQRQLQAARAEVTVAQQALARVGPSGSSDAHLTAKARLDAAQDWLRAAGAKVRELL